MRFELVLTPSEARSLKKMAKNQGVSMANIVAGMIRRAAKRQKVWI